MHPDLFLMHRFKLWVRFLVVGGYTTHTCALLGGGCMYPGRPYSPAAKQLFDSLVVMMAVLVLSNLR